MQSTSALKLPPGLAGGARFSRRTFGIISWTLDNDQGCIGDMAMLSKICGTEPHNSLAQQHRHLTIELAQLHLQQDPLVQDQHSVK